MKKVLITGALGQDGIILSHLYLKKKFKVFGFIKKNKKFRIKKVTYKINNLTSKVKIKKHLKYIKPDIIIHLASSNNSFLKRNNHENYKINYLQNLKCTKNLFYSIIDSKIKPNFIFAGSFLMFEKFKKKAISEKETFNASGYYGKYKIDSHKFILKLKKKHNINAATVILFNHDSKFRNKKFLIPRLIQAFKSKNKKFIENIYKLNISGDFSHAKDVCKGIYKLSLLEKININKIILSSGKRTYINNIIKYLENFFDLKIQKKILKDNINYMPLGSNTLAKKILKYKSSKNLNLACKDLISNYL